MDKVSIIIPNYNCSEFLERCLDSVVNQSYKNKEIIIIDDGSTDNSSEIIDKYIKKHSECEIISIFQSNMNASIARNEGIKVASGKYVLFLDSDDILEDERIELCIKTMKKNKADLVIGNYTIIDTNENIIEDNKDIVGGKQYISNQKFEMLFDVNPVPSNKLYDLNLIKDNNLCFGNVRIGQDLNFYLKYLLVCKKVVTLDESIYKYRILPTSMSRIKNFRIFDIVESFNNVKQYYEINESLNIYNEYIQILELRHYNRQMEKQVQFKTKMERKTIVMYFKINEKKLNYSLMKNFNDYYKRIYVRFKIKTVFSFIYYSKIYNIIKMGIKNEKNKI